MGTQRRTTGATDATRDVIHVSAKGSLLMVHLQSTCITTPSYILVLHNYTGRRTQQRAIPTPEYTGIPKNMIML